MTVKAPFQFYQFAVIFFLGLMLNAPTWAAITPGSIAVSSYANPEITDVSKAVLYVGYADSGRKCTSGNGTDPCDSCTGLSVTVCDGAFANGIACNRSNIYGNLPLKISFAVNDVAKIKAGTSVIKATKDGASLDSFIETSGTTTSANMNANTTLTASILWASIFNKFSVGTDGNIGSSSSKISFKIGVSLDGSTLASSDDQFTVEINYRYIDPTAVSTTDPSYFHTDCPTTDAQSGEGICGFNIKAGDEKVFVKDVYLPKSTWPNPTDISTAGVPFTAARVFYQQTDDTSANKFCSINLSTASWTDLKVNDDATLPVNKIFNLTNEKQYVFLISTLDKAGNVTRFSSRAYLDAETTAKHSATPSQVVGLLDNKKCFVATAAFGSQMAPQVEWIRQFRNHFLLPHGWGRSFVRWYYQNSPPVAQFISQHEGLRLVVRGALWPLVVFSSLCVSYGFWPTLFLVMALVSGVVFVLSRKSNSKSQRKA
jgi:hypothetical protein